MNTRQGAPAGERLSDAERAALSATFAAAVSLLPASFRAAVLNVPAPCPTCGRGMVKVLVERPDKEPVPGLGCRPCGGVLTMQPVAQPLRVVPVE
jgi:hypothetical protein